MKAFILTIVLFIIGTSHSQTVVGGGIYANTTWTAANSPYLLTQSLVIFPGKTLTIEPGTIVRVTADQSFNTGNFIYLEVRGTLNAIGTTSSPITFTSTIPSNESNWLGIRIKGSQGGLVEMDHFKLTNSFYGLHNDIAEPGVSYTFNGCEFKNNQYAVQFNADMVYSNCLFEENGVGNAAQISYGTITASNCQFLNNFCSFTWSNYINISNCNFVGNQNNIIGSPGLITDCTFSNNVNAVTEANSNTIVNCSFENNETAIDASGSMNINNCFFQGNGTAMRMGDNSIITNNQILNNDKGIVITGWSPNSMNISDNIICNNNLYNLENGTDKNFDVNANCFCSSDSSYIEGLIYDGYDDITRGLVNYAIYDDSCQNVLEYVVKVDLGGSATIEATSTSEFQAFFMSTNELKIITEMNQVVHLYDGMGRKISSFSLTEGENNFKTETSPGILIIAGENGSKTRLIQP
ncbi:MAG: right-handed parallel beta-helix repeat-containing protein [Crocinitomicaceae bacterium]|nr:right-handed parallel beta-helix repeat-containing protein [Crocinitomicaceae bacterium]MBP6033273.1 right-handed parallel beta-helix repeat-containing protein [Crocinitomicaceae bacterium]